MTFQPHLVRTLQFYHNIYGGGQLNTNSDYPTLIDLDGDIDLDLVIGGYNGLRYYKNIGTISSPDSVACGYNLY